MINRKGKFSVTFDVVRDHPEAAIQIFSLLQFVPLRAEAMIMGNVVEYEGYSPHFKEVPHGQVIPTYQIMCIRDMDDFNENGEYTPITSIKVVEIQ